MAHCSAHPRLTVSLAFSVRDGSRPKKSVRWRSSAGTREVPPTTSTLATWLGSRPASASAWRRSREGGGVHAEWWARGWAKLAGLGLSLEQHAVAAPSTRHPAPPSPARWAHLFDGDQQAVQHGRRLLLKDLAADDARGVHVVHEALDVDGRLRVGGQHLAGGGRGRGGSRSGG